MLIKQFVRKVALNRQIFLGNFFKRKQTLVSVNQQHPQLNGTKSVELEIVYARVHMLNESGLYKMDFKKLLTRVINKVHIGPRQWWKEY